MEELLDTFAAAKVLGMAVGTLENWRCQGVGPRFVKTARSHRGKVKYRRCDLEAWMDANTFSNTSEVEQAA